MDAGTVRSWLAASAAAIREQRDYLTQLDAAIGDADHGANMDRGFTAVLEQLDGEASSAAAGQAAARRRLHARLNRRRGERPALGNSAQAGRTLARRGRGVRRGRARRRARCCAGRRRRSRRGERGREDHGRRASAGGQGVARARRERRRPRRGARGGPRGRRGGNARDRAAPGTQGARLVPRRALDRPPGPGRHLDGAHTRSARAFGRCEA